MQKQAKEPVKDNKIEHDSVENVESKVTKEDLIEILEGLKIKP